LKKAFDTVNGQALLFKLNRYNIRGHFLNIIEDMYNSVFILQVVMHGEESQVPGDLRQSEILIEHDFKI
jgi:hypothetical protein